MNETQAYNESDRFIHDQLFRRAARVARDVHALWTPGCTGDAGWFWPNRPLRSVEGTRIDGTVLADLTVPSPLPLVERLRRIVQSVDAFGFLVVHVGAEGLEVRFETSVDGVAWLARIHQSADVPSIGPLTEHPHEPQYGILWKPIMA